MHQETADEFHMPQCDPALRFARPAPSCGKSDLRIGHGEDPVVRNGNLMCIAPEVFDGIAEAMESFFYVGTPILFVKAVPEFSPLEGVAQLFAGSGKQQFPLLEKLV